MAMNLEFFSNRAEVVKSLRNKETTSTKFDWKRLLSWATPVIQLRNVAHVNNVKDYESIVPISNSEITDTESILNIRQNKYYRFLAISAYVLIIWIIKRLQRKAMIEGTVNINDCNVLLFMCSVLHLFWCQFHSLILSHFLDCFVFIYYTTLTTLAAHLLILVACDSLIFCLIILFMYWFICLHLLNSI